MSTQTRSEEIRFYVYHAMAGTAQPEGWWATREEAQYVCDGLNISHACPVYEVRVGGPL
jgi:hypothetical protein